MTNLQAALGLAQLERLDEFIERKRWMGQRYKELLVGLPGVQLPQPMTDYADNIYWVYGLVLNESLGFDGQEAMVRLMKLGIGCRPFFFPLHKQPVLEEMGLFRDERYPVADNLGERGVYLPSGLGLSETNINQVVSACRNVFG